MNTTHFATIRRALFAFAAGAEACRSGAVVPVIIREWYHSESADPVDWEAWVSEINAATERRVERDWGGQPYMPPVLLRIERGQVGVMDDREAVFLSYGGGRTEARMRVIPGSEGADVWARINPETVDRIGVVDLFYVGASLSKRTDAIKRHAAPVAVGGDAFYRHRDEGSEDGAL